MKILSLNIQNFLRIEALEIVPSGNSVRITGKNDQGKSSTLRALDVALGGGKAPAEPIRRGENKAIIEVKLGNDEVEVIVTRTYIRRDGKDELAALTVSTPDGARWDKPQNFLDKMLGALSLDPVRFLDMDDEDQARAVRAFIPDFNFIDMEIKNKEDYAERTIVNREVKRLEGEIAALPTFAEGHPTELIDTAEMVSAIEQAAEANAMTTRAGDQIEQMVETIRMHNRSIEDQEDTVADLERRLADAKQKLIDIRDTTAKAQALHTEASAKFAEMKVIDVSELRTKLAEAEEINDNVRDYKHAETRRGRLTASLEDSKAKSAALTKAMDDRKAVARDAIAKAKMPIEGLGFDDEGKVTLNGFAFANTAYSKRLLAAVAIAAAHQPKLRLIKISEGDKLDDDAQKLLAAFAEERDLQIWQETVQHGEPIGFVIEDGKLKGYAE